MITRCFLRVFGILAFVGMSFVTRAFADDNLNCETGYHIDRDTPLSDEYETDGSISRYKSLLLYGTNNSSDTIGLNAGEFDVSFVFGTVKGQALCSATSGDFATMAALEEGTYGQYCWCKTTEYAPIGGDMSSVASDYMFVYDSLDKNSCEENCAETCANNVKDSAVLRAVLFENSYTPEYCKANEISISWNIGTEMGAEAISTTCTYGGNIVLPTPVERVGYTFVGWKLLDNEQE